MNVKIGSEMDPRGSQMALYAQRRGIPASQAMRVQVGATVDPRQKVKDAMLRARVGAPDCNTEQDPRVVASVLASQASSVKGSAASDLASIIAGTGLTPQALAYIDAIINTNKYCPSPGRVGWQFDSLTFQLPAPGTLAANTSANITVTPTQAFCSSALVAAAGNSSDANFNITALTSNSINYVTSTPWIARFYTSEAACCLSVRAMAIAEPNANIVMGVFNPTAAAVIPQAELFGESLFCGGN